MGRLGNICIALTDTKLKYRPEIDGLRAIAVLAVIFFHAGYEIFSGGFIGVDVFFVISGFLITSIIQDELQTSSFSFSRFYERRARRILPTLFVVALASIPLAWLWLLPPYMLEFTKSLSYVATFSSNFFFYKISGYFDTSAELKPLLHIWSLAVEEQYYLAFPALMLAAWKCCKKNLWLLITLIAIASLVYAEYWVQHNPEFAFFLLPSRAWELLVGAIIVQTRFARDAMECPTFPNLQRKIQSAEPTLALIGLLLIIFSIFYFDANSATPGIAALIPTLGAALVISFSGPSCLTGKVLGSRPMVAIGLISYSAYLWHQPIFAFTRHATTGQLGSLFVAIMIIAVLLLAALTWKFVETPFRDKTIIPRQAFFKLMLVAASTLLFFGWAGRKTHGFEDYFYTHRVPENEKSIYKFIKIHTANDFNETYVDNGDCNFRTPQIDDVFLTRFDTCSKKYGKAIIILGDSHAINIYNALQKADFSKFLVGIAKGGCRPHNNLAKCQYDKFSEFVSHHPEQIAYVIYHQSGSYFLSDHAGKLDSPKAFESDKSWLIHKNNIALTITYLDKISNSTHLYWLGPFAEARVDFSRISDFKDGYKMNSVSLTAFDALEQELKLQIANKKNGKWKYISLADILNIDNSFLRVGDCLRFRDTDHFSTCGEEFVGLALKEQLKNLDSQPTPTD